MGITPGYSADFTPAVTGWSLPAESSADSHELVHSLFDQAPHKILLPQNSSEIQKLTLSTSSMKHIQAGFTSLDTVPC